MPCTGILSAQRRGDFLVVTPEPSATGRVGSQTATTLGGVCIVWRSPPPPVGSGVFLIKFLFFFSKFKSYFCVF